MISIIMPTLWRGERYKKMLPLFDQHSSVGEIIVVDNDITSTDQEIFNLKKLKYLPQKENVYVNPAWNLAVLEATCDSICLYSDDVLFDIDVLDQLNLLMSEEKGIFTFSSDSIFASEDEVYIAEWEQKNIVQSNGFHYRSGVCMFMNRNSYYPIPDEYKVYYGDTYLFDTNTIKGKPNYEIQNYFCVTKMKTTSRFFDSIVNQDHEHYKQNNPTEAILINFMDITN